MRCSFASSFRLGKVALLSPLAAMLLGLHLRADPQPETEMTAEPGGSPAFLQLLSQVGVIPPLPAPAPANTLLGQALPTSFVYGGQSSTALLAAWPKEIKPPVEQSDRTIYETVWHEPGGGFVATWHVEVFHQWPAMEFRWIFTNEGSAATKPLTQVNALDLKSVMGDRRFTRLIYSTGGLSGGPIPGFQMKEAPLGGWSLASNGGRSSDGNLPFFVMHVQDPEEGLFFGIGWSGQWQANIGREQGGLVHLTAGMPDTNIALPPGERILTPSILLGSYTGPSPTGTNLLRRMLYAKYTPLINGAKPLPPVSWNSWFQLSNNISDSILKAQADLAAAAGIEYFCIDAGWFEGDFPDGVGNWTVNQKKFSQGLGPIGDYVAQKGMKLGLWFEPERVAANTRLTREHPEWIRGHLVDFGNPAARDWIFAMMKSFIDQGHVQWIRWDFNFAPLQTWSAADVPGQQGLTQIRHIMGLYDLLDRLMRAYPNLFVEGCASGGLRIDLETIRRSHTFWKSDETNNLIWMRFHETGGNVFLPGQLLNTNVPAQNIVFDTTSVFGGPLGFSCDWTQLKPEQLQQIAHQIALYKQLRPLLNEDYYPLFVQDETGTSWVGWQFYSPTHGTGYLVILRPHDSPFLSAQISLRGMDPNASYTLTPTNDPAKASTLTGAQLTQGFPLELGPETSVIYQYAKVK
jgi:alpha-galactosidase